MVGSGTRKRDFLACHAALLIPSRSWQLSVASLTPWGRPACGEAGDGVLIHGNQSAQDAQRAQSLDLDTKPGCGWKVAKLARQACWGKACSPGPGRGTRDTNRERGDDLSYPDVHCRQRNRPGSLFLCLLCDHCAALHCTTLPSTLSVPSISATDTPPLASPATHPIRKVGQASQPPPPPPITTT